MTEKERVDREYQREIDYIEKTKEGKLGEIKFFGMKDVLKQMGKTYTGYGMPRRSKYGANKTVMYGIEFDSKKEATRYGELLILQKAGQITDLKRQVKYELIPAQYIDGKCVERACNYVADFVYYEMPYMNVVVEDTKGFRTPEYIIKRKLMLQKHGLRIKEI